MEPAHRGPAYRLSANENPYPPLPGTRAAVAEVGANANRYPDPTNRAFISAVAERHGVPEADVVVGPGAAGVFAQTLLAFRSHGDEVVFPWPSFEGFPAITGIVGAQPVPVPLTPDHRHDLDAMAAAVTGRTRLVVVCSPNNPTGTVTTSDELTGFLDRLPSDLPVVLDEAYTHFVRDRRVPDGLALYRRYPQLVVLRSFSKAYGLAALRAGFAVATAEVAGTIRAAGIPYAVNQAAQAAAIAALAEPAELARRVDAIVAERARVTAGLVAAGWAVPSSEANFVWLPIGARAAEFGAACARAGVAVKAYDGVGVRCTIGEPAANDALLAVARENATVTV